jgi:glutamate--cysteine ligase
MFLFRRGDVFVQNTGQTFRSFLADGYAGHRATYADWQLHVNTLFPEVRLKRTIEVRGADMLPSRLVGSLPAITTGIIYDADSLSQAAELTAPLRYDEVEAARPALVRDGLAASIGKTPAQELALRLLDIAEGGLKRRARIRGDGEDESVYLAPIRELTLRGHSPADTLRQGLSIGDEPTAAQIIARTRI